MNPSIRTRAFQALVTALVLAIAYSAVHGWVNLQESVDQAGRILGPGAPAPGAAQASADLYRADLVSLSVVMLAACFLAAMLTWKTPERPDARVLALFLVFVFFPDDVLRAALRAMGWDVDDRQLKTLAWIPMWFALAAFVRFSVLFPCQLTEQDVEQAWRQRRKTRLSGGTSSQPDSKPPSALGDGAMEAAPPWYVRIWYPLLRWPVVWGAAAALSSVTLGLVLARIPLTPLWPVFALVVVLAVVRGTLHLRLAYKRCDQGDRRQILWIVHGFYAATWSALLIFVLVPILERYAPGFTVGGLSWLAIGQVLLALPLVLIVVSLYIGVFHSGALDPRRAIRGTTTYGLVILGEIVLFGTVEELTASTVAARVFGKGASAKGTLVAGLVVAVAFQPLKQWVGRMIGRDLTAPGTRYVRAR